MKLKSKDCKWLVALTYPEYTGRKFRLQVITRYYCSNYWSGGSRNYVMAVEFNPDGTMVIRDPCYFNPITDERAFSEIDMTKIPNNIMLVEHAICSGKDCGISFYVGPNSNLVQKFLDKE